jgi:hypothetical protein
MRYCPHPAPDRTRMLGTSGDITQYRCELFKYEIKR